MKKHFINVNFQKFSLQDQNQCGTGFLELRLIKHDHQFDSYKFYSDSIHDSDHMRRYCSNLERKKWYTTSNKLYMEYLFDIEDTKD